MIAMLVTVPSASVAEIVRGAGRPRRVVRLPPQSIVGWLSPPVHEWVGEAVLRGFGVPAAKSAAFEFVSVQPPFARSTAVRVAESSPVGPVPSKQFALVP